VAGGEQGGALACSNRVSREKLQRSASNTSREALRRAAGRIEREERGAIANGRWIRIEIEIA
jgi:hypothetical protein